MISLEYKYKETEFNDITNTLGDFEDTRGFFLFFLFFLLLTMERLLELNYYHLREFSQVTFSAKKSFGACVAVREK